MDYRNIVERAFELAPECRSLDALRARLKQEGYLAVDAHFSSRSLRRDLSRTLLNGGGPEPRNPTASPRQLGT